VRRLAALLLLAAAGPLSAQDAPAVAEKPAVLAALTVEKTLDAATVRARDEKKPLVVLTGPGWYEHPSMQRLDDEVLASAPARKTLAAFVLVRLDESEDREVHVRHRLEDRGYPLAVVLAPDGAFLGSVSGLPKRWVEKVAAVPARAERMDELMAVLRDKGEDPDALAELARLRFENVEPARAAALCDRLELADRDNKSGHLAEVRYLKLRIATARHLAARRFRDVEGLCRKWLRRFPKAPERPDVLLLQANARYLNGEADKAKTVWNELVEKHADTPAGKRAQECLDEL
jgi:hypothetical protein